jgi:hypothetical protein
MKKLLLSIIAGAALVASGCGNATDLVAPAPAEAQIGGGFTQVEFLARPGIGEGLLFTNSLLNTYNAVTPRFVNTALTVPGSAEADAAAPIFAEATTVLDILTGLVAAGPTTADVVGGFLPDVMRIDTSLDFSPNLTGLDDTSAYGSAFNASASPVAGRKLTDDTIDITLGYLTGGAIPGDNVGYYPIPGNPAVGHQPLNGETVNFGPSTFPYLAPAN